MNETNESDPLEAQLRSWTPRHPSAALERRLFRRKKHSPRPALVAGWLAPAAACALFAALILNPQSSTSLSHSAQSDGMLAFALSNQNYAAYLPGSFQRTHNQLERFSRASSGDFLAPTNLIH